MSCSNVSWICGFGSVVGASSRCREHLPMCCQVKQTWTVWSETFWCWCAEWWIFDIAAGARCTSHQLGSTTRGSQGEREDFVFAVPRLCFANVAVRELVKVSHGQVRVVPFRTRFFAAFSSAWIEPVLLEKGPVGHCHAYSTLHATWFTKADVKWWT